MIGTILGLRYELLEKIGDGGMSEVYKAKCNKLNRYVAVKILKKEFANNIEISNKFRREATAVANLIDANIVSILDVGTQDDIDYIVMEYVKGSTLKEVIRHNGKLSSNTAIKVALQIAKALDCAHKNNIIHRDIKPQNILVAESGEIKVTDFGIAKLADSKTMTNTKSVIGSAHYLSPEQAKGTYIDVRSDIYSFGILMYEMVTGKLPFDGESPVTVALKHIQEEPVAPKNVNPGVLSSLNELILKCIEKEPIRRYQNIKEIIIDLNKIKENPDIVLLKKEEFNDDKTIIMSSLPNNDKTTFIKKSEEDYEDDDEEDYEDDDEKEYSSKKKKKTILTVVLAIVSLLVLLTVGYLIAVGSNKSKSEILVPNLIGLTLEEAEKKAEELGIKVQVSGTEISSEEKDTIIKINPKVGSTIPKGSVVGLILSGGEETFIMPDFSREYEVTNIKQILSSQGYTNYNIIEDFSDDVKVGYMISQSPEANSEVKKDTPITITISKGPETKLVVVPGVVGKKESIAKTELEAVKLTTNIEYKTTNNEKEDGIVLSQSIEGNKVEEGTPITIYVGKYEEKIINIRTEVGLKEGQTILEARSRLDVAGIDFNINGPSDDNAIILSFSETIKESGTVTINSKSAESEKPDNSNDQSNQSNQSNQ